MPNQKNNGRLVPIAIFIASSILTQLLRLNSEFSNYVPEQYQTPKVVLAPTGNPEYFPVGVKHRYTGNQNR